MNYRTGLIHGALLLLTGEVIGWMVREWFLWMQLFLKLGGY